jgi:hypothetical protein
VYAFIVYRLHTLFLKSVYTFAIMMGSNVSCLSLEQECEAMTSKEREIFYRLLVDLFLDHPSRRMQTNGQERRRKNNHEKVSTHARGPRRTAGQTDPANR